MCITLLTGPSLEARAETPEDVWRLWGGFGGGFASNGAAAMGELVFQKGPHQLTARAVVAMDPYASVERPTGEIGLLYGRSAMWRQGHASLSAGLAVTDTDMDSEEGMTLGVPLVAETGLRIFPFLGVGTQLFGNVNSIQSYSGLVLFLELGYLPSGH